MPTAAATVFIHLTLTLLCIPAFGDFDDDLKQLEAQKAENDKRSLGAEDSDSWAGEDPEVAAYFKKREWRMRTEARFIGDEAIRWLYVEGGPLTREDYSTIARSRKAQWLMIQSEVTDEGLGLLAGLKQMKGLSVYSDTITDEGLGALASCKELEDLHLMLDDKTPFTAKSMKALSSLPKLRKMMLLSGGFESSFFQSMIACKSLKELSILYGHFSDADASHVARMPALRSLELSPIGKITGLTAKGIQSIAQGRLPGKFVFPSSLLDDVTLEILINKKWYPGEPPVGSNLDAPSSLTEVRSIDLNDSRVTDRGFRLLVPCTNTEALFLARSGITDVSLKKLGDFRKLYYLELSQTKVTAAGLRGIESLQIKNLLITNTVLTEEMFKVIGRMSAIEELTLTDSRCKGEWIKHLVGVPKLRKLSIINTDFDDTSVIHLMALKTLEELSLNKTKLTDKGLSEIVKLPALRQLFLDQTKVTKAGYAAAKAAKPDCLIYAGSLE